MMHYGAMPSTVQKYATSEIALLASLLALPFSKGCKKDSIF